MDDMAAMTNHPKTPITEIPKKFGAEVQQITGDYILICYDIPEKASKVRTAFLKKAHEIGAMKYTESNYLLPNTPKSFGLAAELAAVGDAVIWISDQPNMITKKDIEDKYKKHVDSLCAVLMERLKKARQYFEEGNLGHAQRMSKKTGKMLMDLAQIYDYYPKEWLGFCLKNYVGTWKAIYGAISKAKEKKKGHGNKKAD